MQMSSVLLCYRMTFYLGHQLPWKIFSNQFSGLNALDSLPCLMFLVCLRDTFMPEDRKLRDPRRLYAPGRIYHIVERKFCRCGRFPPEVRTAIPVEGRFEHIVLSCNATSDHGILWIEKEAQKALERMRDSLDEDTVMTPPTIQKFERTRTLEKEHKDALERAVSLNVPHAVMCEDETLNPVEPPPEAVGEKEQPLQPPPAEGGEEENKSIQIDVKEGSHKKSKSSGGGTNWDLLVQKLFNKNVHGKEDIQPPK